MHDSDGSDTKRRRTVLRATAGTLLLGSLAGCSESSDGDGTATDTPADTATPTAEPTTTNSATETPETSEAAEQSADDTVVVDVGPAGEYRFEPRTEDPLSVTPGTTVRFVWRSDNHSLRVTAAPDGSSWAGHETVEDAGFEHEHTFETTGEYEVVCEPHRSLGMVGTIIVSESGQPATTTGSAEDPVRLGDDGTAEIRVGADGDFAFEPGTERPVSVPPGTQVTFVWESDNHNVHMEQFPPDSTWTNEDAQVYDAGHERTHTFEATGRYEFVCQPHVSLGAEGVLLVESTE